MPKNSRSPFEHTAWGTNPLLVHTNRLLYRMVYWICEGCLRINTQIPKVHPLHVEPYIKLAIHITQKIKPFLWLILTCVLSSSTLPASALWPGIPWFLFGAAREMGCIFGTVIQKQKLFKLFYVIIKTDMVKLWNSTTNFAMCLQISLFVFS
jgi:hypothetical protein